MSFDRPLNFKVTNDLNYVKKTVGEREFSLLDINYVSHSITADGKERLWVVTN